MDKQDIIETPIWGLYEKGRNFHRRTGIYTDTDRNYQFYNGNQWEGAKLGEVEPVQKNFIRPIVRYKLAVIHDNLYAINYSSQNHESKQFIELADRYCKMLNSRANKIWERDQMDKKLRAVTKDAAINSEGIIYVTYDVEKGLPVNEVVDKSDIYYGNENDPDIQAQPYILIRKRMSVSNAMDFALAHGASEADLEYIIGDNDNFDEAGEAAKEELDDAVTVVYKLYRKDGTVHYSIATRYIEIVNDADIGLSLYPVAHMVWEDKKGSARGEGEVKYLIPNQIEVNRTEIRRVLTVKYQAHPHRVVDTLKIANPEDLNRVGSTIKTNGQPVDDVLKAVGVIQPAMMSPDVVKLQEDLIQMTRELAGAGETATGQVNPEDASGRAILAVQQASQAPMTEQREACKYFIEDIGRIWLEYIVAYAEGGITLEEEAIDPMTGAETIRLVNVPQSALERLQADVKIDITPKGVYDRFAQEQTLENFLINGMFNVEKLPELKVYVESLDDDSVAPKRKLEKIVKRMEQTQLKIAITQAQGQLMQQNAQQFLMGDPDQQAAQISDARLALMAEQAAAEEAPIEGEEEYAEKEAELDEQVDVPEEE